MKLKHLLFLAGLIAIIIFGSVVLKRKYSDSFKPILNVKLSDHLLKHIESDVLGKVLKEKYNVIYNQDKGYDLIIYDVYDHSYTDNDDKAIKIFYTDQAALPNIDDYDLVIGFNHLEHPKYFRMPSYYNAFGQKITVKDVMRTRKARFFGDLRPEKKLECQPENKTIFACFAANNDAKGVSQYPGNGLSFDGRIAAERLFHKLSLYKDVKSGGSHLNNIGKIISAEKVDKWISRCKFVITYEDQSYDGYITEKVFRAYFGGTIPIYYSHPNAVLDINKKAVIYAGDFADEDALVEYIKKVDNDDKLYCDIWNENIMTDPKMNYTVIYKELRGKVFKLLDEKLHK